MQPVHALPEHSVQVAAEVSADAVLSQHLHQRACFGTGVPLPAPWLRVRLRDYGQRVVPVSHQRGAAPLVPAQTLL